MKVLFLTGADGWLGKAIINFLIESKKNFLNFDYLVLQTLNPKFSLSAEKIKVFELNKIKIKYVHGCIMGEKLPREINDLVMRVFNNYEIYVIHAASVIHPKKVSLFKKINYLGLKNLYNALDCNRLRKFTYISSNSPFGFNNNSEFNENSKYNPKGGYGESKKLAEKYLLNIKDSSDKITILRAPWFHGLNMPARQKSFLKKVINGNFPIVNYGKNKRSVVNTIDLAQAAINVTFKDRKSNIYWICDEKAYSMNEMIKIIQLSYLTIIGKPLTRNYKASFINLPIGFSAFFYRLDLILQNLGIYNTLIHVLGELGQNIFCSSKKYRDEFYFHKWNNLPDSIEKEIKEIL